MLGVNILNYEYRAISEIRMAGFRAGLGRTHPSFVSPGANIVKTQFVKLRRGRGGGRGRESTDVDSFFAFSSAAKFFKGSEGERGQRAHTLNNRKTVNAEELGMASVKNVGRKVGLI